MTTVTAARSPAPSLPRPAEREAQALTGRPYLSHTQLSTYRSCPRKFAFLYVEKTNPDFQPSALLFGSALHTAMEHHYRARLEGQTVTPGELFHAFVGSWNDEVEARAVPIRFNKGEDFGSIREMAQRMIAAFLESPISRPAGRIVAIEERFRVALDNDLPDILAKVDLVTQTTNPGSEALHVVDLKTSRSRWNEVRVAESAEQLLLYGQTVRSVSEGLPIKLHFAVITKAKTPVVQVLDVPSEEPRLDLVRANVGQVWQSARQGNFYPNPSPLSCSTCPFKSKCPAFTTTA